ncbi:MAG: hypothetical protein WAL84_01915, partial [Candidatus Dormiibacterota bacterium]
MSEIADYFGISRSNVLRNIHNGIYPAVVRVGNQCLILSPAFAEMVQRTLPEGDERRMVQDELDGLIAKDAAEARKQQEDLEKDRKERMSAAGQRKTAKAAEAERDRKFR